jgi:beta-lactamase class A
VQDYAQLRYTPQRRSPKKILQIVLFVSIFIILSTTIFALLLSNKQDHSHIAIISPLAESIEETYHTVLGDFDSGLKDVVEDSLQGTTGEYAVVIKHMGRGDTFARNEHKEFLSASLYKLWLMATAYKQIQDGVLKPTTLMSDTAESINNRFSIASESAERNEGQIAMTVQEAINRSITFSDNYSALLLTGRVKVSQMNAFLKQEKFTQSKLGTATTEPATTAYDIALFYEKLYNKQLISEKASEDMIAILKKQQLNDRIPKYLPQYVQTAHKTGELYGFKHDAGIVYTPSGDYILVVLTDTANPAQAAEITARLSEKVYAYFSK